MFKIKAKPTSSNINQKKKKKLLLTLEEREEVVGDESGGFGTSMAVVDTDIRGGRRGEHLSLVLERRVGLDDGDGEVAGGVGLEIHVPHQSISTAVARSEAHLQWPTTQLQHLSYVSFFLFFFFLCVCIVFSYMYRNDFGK